MVDSVKKWFSAKFGKQTDKDFFKNGYLTLEQFITAGD